MKRKVEDVVEKGYIADEYKTNAAAAKAFSRWGKDFTILSHPAIIEVNLYQHYTSSKLILIIP